MADPTPVEGASAPAEARRALYGRYAGFVPLGMGPLAVTSVLMASEYFERLPTAAQVTLVVLVCASTLFVVGLLVLPWSRPYWLELNVYDPRHWWGYILPTANTIYVGAMATWGFALLSGYLYVHGMVTTVPPGALDDPSGDSALVYVWSFLSAIPVLELPETLGWERPARFSDRVSPVLLLVYKLLVILPVLATVTIVVRDLRGSGRTSRA